MGESGGEQTEQTVNRMKPRESIQSTWSLHCLGSPATLRRESKAKQSRRPPENMPSTQRPTSSEKKVRVCAFFEGNWWLSCWKLIENDHFESSAALNILQPAKETSG